MNEAKSLFQRTRDAGIQEPHEFVNKVLMAMPPVDRVCHCESCKGTLEAARRQADILLENQCPIYVYSLATILGALSKAMLLAWADHMNEQEGQGKDGAPKDLKTILAETQEEQGRISTDLSIYLLQNIEHITDVAEALIAKHMSANA